MNEPTADLSYTRAMKRLRHRRWFLWGIILIYVPAIWLSLRITGSDRATGVVFALWLLLVCVAVVRAAFALCPRCGNTFHMNGFIPVYLRRCVHCGLHVTQDSPSEKEADEEEKTPS
ncbi:hypothetical protein MJO47_07680 [Desulfuromonas sp. KJ2020]|uniref:hypothetical protein n=1 Tax=Desulfuromonas sp. KJ2020 TaxID=2919173 RepID=UPI0020A78431|nr:hypothetical protein [Desulfuromonas sp. KJ2020]MCP3176983.1 hypothetical protein [Desulfuromonas sp. KJ2020]